MSPDQVISYFRACYQADNRDVNLSDIFARKLSQRLIIEGKEELANGFMPYIPIPQEAAENYNKTLQVYGREKDFFYFCLFIIGKSRNFQGKLQKICAPLFFYPAQIVQENDLYYMQIDHSNRRLNFPILRSLKESDDDESRFYDDLREAMPDDTITEGNIHQLSQILKHYIPHLDTSELLFFPELTPEKKLKRMLQNKQLEDFEGFRLIAAAGAGLLDKSTDTMGILNELNRMQKSKQQSQPVQSLLAAKLTNMMDDSTGIGRVPAILSAAQQNILKHSARYPFSLVIGPPGTGKSYTIAALTLERFSQGKAILIASRTDQAVDVVADKIERQLGIEDVIIRAGRSSYLRQLKKHLQNLLSGNFAYKETTKEQVAELEKELVRLEKKINQLEDDFIKRVEQENKWGNYLAEKTNNKGLIVKLKSKYIQWRNNMNTAHWLIIKELEQALEQRNDLTVRLIKQKYALQVQLSLQEHRQSLNTFLKALKARTGLRQEKLFDQIDLRIILKAFPIWLVKMSDIYKVLPLDRELFDIAIIDEATQCDIASCLPIMHRARHAVFAGDPNQLRHVSFLSQARQKLLQQQHDLENYPVEKLNYRKNSILDLVSDSIQDQQQVVFLDEHYRSLPAIIRFSNAQFYSNNLRIMTARPDRPENEGLEMISCKGQRNDKGYNEKEAGMLIAHIERLIDEQVNLNATVCDSIGILSPLRNQVDYMQTQVQERLDYGAIAKHRITVGTAYSFQGEERDIMFISLAVDDQSHPSALYHINKPDVFNVSITRARVRQYVYFSIDPKNLKTDSLLRQYLDGQGFTHQEEQTSKTRDRFLEEVIRELDRLNLPYWPAYPVAGLTIDLITQYQGKSYGIDLIGYPGVYQEAFSLERYKMLQRAGLNTFALPYTYWQADKEACLYELLSTIGYYKDEQK